MIRRWYRVLRARLGLPPKRDPDPCEVCGTRSRRNVTITANVTVADDDLDLAMPGGGEVSATYCPKHDPERNPAHV